MLAGVQLGEDELVGFVVAVAQAGDAGEHGVASGDGCSGDGCSSDAGEGTHSARGGGALMARLRELQSGCTQLQSASLERLRHALDAPARRARGGSAAYTRVAADGTCSHTGAQLRALPLAPAERRGFLDALLAAAAAESAKAGDDLRRFGEWVANNDFSYVIDGANVGYRQQNIDGGTFSFAQVEVARVALRARGGGAEPLIVVPRRYLSPRLVPNRTNRRAAHRRAQIERYSKAVSYTHLTLPTICSV